MLEKEARITVSAFFMGITEQPVSSSVAGLESLSLRQFRVAWSLLETQLMAYILNPSHPPKTSLKVRQCNAKWPVGELWLSALASLKGKLIPGD